MALKGDRLELETTVHYFMNEEATRGGMATLSTAASGAALDNSVHLVTYVATAVSGAVPIGLLLNDMVNVDQTRQHINQHKNEVQQGGKVTLLRKGNVTTSSIVPAITPVAGEAIFVGHSGLLTNVQQEGAFQVGEFESSPDEDGYVSANINLPATNRVNLA